ncbi:MAG: hypothetical protein ACE5OY_06610 [Candidatus Bathyarchaeia archaeon]
MSRRAKAILVAAYYFLIFAVAPTTALRYVPEQLVTQMSSMVDLDLQTILTTLALIGLGMAGTAYVSNMTDRWSPLHLISAVTQRGFTLFLFLYCLGLENVWSFGLTERPISVGSPGAPEVTILLDFRSITMLFALYVGFGVATEILGFYFSRKEGMGNHQLLDVGHSSERL